MALGNVRFVETKPDQAAVAPASKEWLETAADILKVGSAVLAEKLVTRELRIMNQEATICAQDEKQASDSRHALCKFAYARMFDWLVQRVNQSMEESSGKVKGKGLLAIGILDIFGFEIFKHNSFEQLCIKSVLKDSDGGIMQCHYKYLPDTLPYAMRASLNPPFFPSGPPARPPRYPFSVLLPATGTYAPSPPLAASPTRCFSSISTTTPSSWRRPSTCRRGSSGPTSSSSTTSR